MNGVLAFSYRAYVRQLAKKRFWKIQIANILRHIARGFFPES